MLDQKARAAAVLKLLNRAVADDDQESFDLIVSIVEREELFVHYADDAGSPFDTMADFAAALESEHGAAGGSVTSAAGGSLTNSVGGNRPLSRMTTEERYQQRMAALGK
jgi:hypothetical protein